MKKSLRQSRLLKLECAQCGMCCRDPLIEVTDSDLRRLVKHTKIPSDKLVILYSNSELESDEEHDWVKLSYGKRILGLSKKRNGDCMFLTGDNNCTAYEARPMSCRLFPINVTFNDNDKVTGFELSDLIRDKFISCKRTYGKGRSYNKFVSMASDAQKEYEKYCDRVEKWNGNGAKGNKNEYLRFLGFKTSE